MSKKWPREVVFHKLRERRRAGLSLSYLDLAREDPALRYNLRKLRGGWSGALLSIGENADYWRPVRQWSSDKVVAYLKECASNKTLSFAQICKKEANLVFAVRRHFGSWNAALAAANIDSISYPQPVRKSREKITANDVTAEILKRHNLGLPVSQSKMEPRTLVAIGILRFGCWSKALVGAGLDPEVINLHKKWSEERVISEIRERAALGSPLNSSALRRGKLKDLRLYNASTHYFESWDNALISAGIQPVTVRVRQKWSQERVTFEIRALLQSGRKVTSSVLRRENENLLQASVQHFGTWSQAISAAGGKSQIRRKTWTRSRILLTLRQQATDIVLKSFPRSFLPAAIRLFGSWKRALKFAFPDRCNFRKSAQCPRK